MQASSHYSTELKIKTKNKEEKLKTKTDMLRRNGPVESRRSQSWRSKSVYGGKDLWNV